MSSIRTDCGFTATQPTRRQLTPCVLDSGIRNFDAQMKLLRYAAGTATSLLLLHLVILSLMQGSRLTRGVLWTVIIEPRELSGSWCSLQVACTSQYQTRHSLVTGPAPVPGEAFTPAMAPGASGQQVSNVEGPRAFDASFNTSAFPPIAEAPANISASIESAGISQTFCDPSNCGETCSAYTARERAAAPNNYLYFTYLQSGASQSCGTFNAYIRYNCCPETCTADSDCATGSDCGLTTTPPNNFFVGCNPCDTTYALSAKCRQDQACTYPCCLNAAQTSCGASTPSDTYDVSGNLCCPSGRFASTSINGGALTCSCTASQTCPAAPPPPSPPPLSPPTPPPPPPQSSPVNYVNSYTPVPNSPYTTESATSGSSAVAVRGTWLLFVVLDGYLLC